MNNIVETKYVKFNEISSTSTQVHVLIQNK